MKPLLLASIETGRPVPCAPGVCKTSSARSPWQHVLVHQLGPVRVQQSNLVAIRHLVIVQLEGSASFTWSSYGTSAEVVQPPGHFSLFPAFARFSLDLRNAGEFLLIALDPQFVREAAAKVTAPSRHASLNTCHGLCDPLVRGVGLALKAEIEAGYRGGHVYGESLARTLAVQLVRFGLGG